MMHFTVMLCIEKFYYLCVDSLRNFHWHTNCRREFSVVTDGDSRQLCFCCCTTGKHALCSLCALLPAAVMLPFQRILHLYKCCIIAL